MEIVIKQKAIQLDGISNELGGRRERHGGATF